MEDKICIGLIGNRERDPMDIVRSFFFANRVGRISVYSLVEEISKELSLEADLNEEGILIKFAKLIENDYDKAVEVLKRSDYKEMEEPPTLAGVLGLEKSNYDESLVLVDEHFMLNTIKEKPYHPWDTRRDFYTNVMKKNRKSKKNKRKR